RGGWGWLSCGLVVFALLLACGRRPQGPAAATPVPPTATPPPLAGSLRTEVVADGLQLPANLVFAPDGRLFLSEVSLGNIRVVDHRRLLPEPVATLDVSGVGEQGLLGLALDPDFSASHQLYAYYSQARSGASARNRVVRLTESGNRAAD